MLIRHRNILGAIRKEFDEAKDLGMVAVVFSPELEQLDIHFLNKASKEQIYKVGEYLKSKWKDDIIYDVFSLPTSMDPMLRIKNVRQRRIQSARRTQKIQNALIKKLSKNLCEAIDKDIIEEVLNSMD